MMRTICCCGVACLLSASLVRADSWHVDIAHPAGGNGTTWATAFTYLQDALDAAASGDTIKVAGSDDTLDPAIYHPDDGAGHTQGNRTETFTLVSGVQLLGGYIGWDDLLDPDIRRPELYLTRLSGDLADNDGPGPFDNNGENSYHVVFALNVSGGTLLDGFIIEAGNADEDWGFNSTAGGAYLGGEPIVRNCTIRANWAEGVGGGTYSSGGATFRHCTFRGNRGSTGGAVYFFGYAPDRPSAIDCLFDGNIARAGGAVANSLGGGSLINCVFIANQADDQISARVGIEANGGAVSVRSSLTMTNCAFIENTADDHGGAVHTRSGSPTLTNCTFFENTADHDGNNGGDGGGIFHDGGNMEVANCVFWSNSDQGGMDESAQIHVAGGTPVVNYTDLQGGWTGAGGIGNINADPEFADPPDDLRLLETSPCIDVGDNGAVPDDQWDIDGDGCADDCVAPSCCEPTPELDLYPRIVAGPSTNLQCDIVDMGAYEYADACDDNCFDGDECTPPYECTEDDVCEYVCRDRIYGDIAPFGAVVPPCTAEDRATIGNGFSDMLDVFCAFNQYNAPPGPWTICPCCDVSPCGGDGFCNMLDVLALFDAFGHIYQCDHPCVCDDCGESMAMGGGAPDGSRIVESGDILVGILTTIEPVSVDRYRYGVEAITDWLIERMTMDQRGALADKLEDPSQKFANDRVARMVPAIVSALRGE